MEEDNKPSREELENSIPLNLNLVLPTQIEEPINKVVDIVYSQLSLEPHNKNKVKNNLKVLLLNLADNYYMDKELYTAIHLDEKKYIATRYNKCNVTKSLPKIVHALDKAEFIEFWKGHYFTKSKKITRIRPYYKLIKLIEEKGVNPDLITHHPETETVICQEKKKLDSGNKIKIPLYYEDTEETHSFRKLMVDYNNLLNQTHIDVYWTPKKGIIFGKADRPVKVNQNKKFMRRIFNDTDFETNGRIYGGFWQQLNRDWRGRVAINGQPVSEVDYSHLGISTLYDKFEKPKFEGDAYDISSVGYDYGKFTKKELRPLLKYALMIMVNSESKEQAIKGLRYKVYKDKDLPSESEVPLEPLMEAFAKRHEPIKEFFYQGMGGKQYRMDSEICAKIIAYFLYDIKLPNQERAGLDIVKRDVLKKNPEAKGLAWYDGYKVWEELEEMFPVYKKGGIPVLTVHDSFLIDSGLENVLKWQMEAQYKLELGVKFDTEVPTKTEWKEQAKEMHMETQGIDWDERVFKTREEAVEALRLKVRNNPQLEGKKPIDITVDNIAPQVRGEELEWDKDFSRRVKTFPEEEGKTWFNNYYKLKQEPKDYYYKNEWQYIDITKGIVPPLKEKEDRTGRYVEDKNRPGFYDYEEKKSYQERLRKKKDQ